MARGRKFIGVALSPPGFSSAETKTGATWIDGKPIYRVVVDLGGMPNANDKTVAIPGNPQIDFATALFAVGRKVGAITQFRQIGHSENAKTPANESALELQIDGSGVASLVLEAELDWSLWLQVYAVVEYTKTTD